MIILDTNVVSEPLKPSPDGRVVAWLDRQASDTLFLTTVNLAELLYGVEVLPDGKRRRRLTEGLTDLLQQLFGGRILPFDELAARTFAQTQSQARRNGVAISMADGQIAAIARSNNFSIATRDAEPFAAAGIKVIDPWTT